MYMKFIPFMRNKKLEELEKIAKSAREQANRAMFTEESKERILKHAKIDE